VQIRPAGPADAEPIAELVQRAYARYIKRIGRRSWPMEDDYGEKVAQGRVSVAVDAQNEVFGLIVLIQEPDRLLVENVAVAPEHQSQGIGRALLAFAETIAAETNLTTLRLYTNAAMTENLALYPRLGYTETARRTENGFERVFFVKQIVL
jgi:ribosomal protein S18 acetylase RimI-like enzyme